VKGSLLLVDDEPGIRDSLGEFFMGEGYHVALAASEEEAFQVYRTQRPTVVVSDLNLAPGSGIKLFKRMREHDTEQPSPFCILMTGFGTMDNAIEALRNGADEYLTKPLHLKDLRKAVDAGFARYQARAEKEGQGTVSVERLVREMNAPLRRMRADLELLDLGRLGPLNPDQGTKVQAVQASLRRLLQALQTMQAQGGASDLDIFLEALEPEALLRQVQLGYLSDLERKGVSVVQSLPKGLPLVWTDRLHASAMIDLAFCSCLSLARPGSTISLEWDQTELEPTLCFKVLDCEAAGGATGAWPSPAELAPFNRANIAVEAYEQGCRIVLRFRGVRPS
jgi:ActR/RegA family two-component response regulator